MEHILVVDDNSTCRNSIMKILQREGYDVREACSADGALEALNGHAFDLMVCDYRMPGKSGLDLLAELHHRHSRMPVLMVSAFADSETLASASRLGAKGMLHKPFRRQELVDKAYQALHPPPQVTTIPMEII